MKKGILSIAVIVLVFEGRLAATIINIPDDYPTIQQGIDASNEGDTVLVQPGTYVENINFNGHNIALGSLFLNTGDTAYISETVIDGGSSGSVVSIINQENSLAIIAGFTIQNGFSNNGAAVEIFQSSPLVENNVLRNNFASVGGGAIDCFHASPRITNNTIMDNFTTYKGGAIYCSFSDATISNNVIIYNSSGLYGGGIACYFSNSLITNNTLFRNKAPLGGGLACWGVSRPEVMNTIIWRNMPHQIYVDGSADAEITFSAVQSGWPGAGNIQENPHFRNSGKNDFRLRGIECGFALNSSCIDAGHPDILDSLLDCSWGLGELRSDMGAYGGGDPATVAVNDIMDRQPSQFALLQSYPNPFNATTIIRYTLPGPANVRIEIFDILGRIVATLIDGEQQAGQHRITWNADEQPSGVYFARLATIDRTENVKMVLLK